MRIGDKDCRYLNLYPEDFDSDSIWEDICDSVDVPYDTKSITIFYDSNKTKINEVVL